MSDTSTTETELDPDFLADYTPRSEWARKRGITDRTAQRYQNEPDGLPVVYWGGKAYVPNKGGAEFIARRVKRRNPVRR